MTVSVKRWFSAELAASAFLESYPLYTYVVSRLAVRDTTDVAVMAVAGSAGEPLLFINRAFFGDSSPYFAGVLLHEIHHVVLGHLTDPRFRAAACPQAMTIAKEISANEDIVEPLPGEPIRLEQYAALGIAPGQSTWARYELIAAAMQDESADVPEVPPDAIGCADTPAELVAPGAGTGAIDSRVVAELIAAVAAAAKLSDGPATIAGRTPGELLESLGAVNASAAALLDWKSLLRRFGGRRRGREASYMRINRRFPMRMGEIPGRTRFPGDARRKLLAVIDTSGSMEAALVRELLTELRHLGRHADVTVVECDAEIQRVYPIERCPGTVRGRGGTDLRPPFEQQFLEKHRPDGIVYFTDGLGPWPARPPRTETLWVLTDSRPFDCPWGRQVRIRVPGFSSNPFIIDSPSARRRAHWTSL